LSQVVFYSTDRRDLISSKSWIFWDFRIISPDGEWDLCLRVNIFGYSLQKQRYMHKKHFWILLGAVKLQFFKDWVAWSVESSCHWPFGTKTDKIFWFANNKCNSRGSTTYLIVYIWKPPRLGRKQCLKYSANFLRKSEAKPSWTPANPIDPLNAELCVCKEQINSYLASTFKNITSCIHMITLSLNVISECCEISAHNTCSNHWWYL
jgi:hypothetical protein